MLKVECKPVTVSIRAPREGGDYGRPVALRLLYCFNARPPRRGRWIIRQEMGLRFEFQSAPPAKGAIPPTLTIWERDRYTRVFANPVQSENAKICPKLSKNWMIES